MRIYCQWLCFLMLVILPAPISEGAPKTKTKPKANPAWDEDVVKPSKMVAAPAPSSDHRHPHSMSLGLSAQFPELGTVDGFFQLGRWVKLRVFAMAPVNFNVRVELPRDQIAAKQGVVIENPDVEIKFKATYGPSYGAELMYFPFAHGLYLGGGFSRRKLTLKGGGQTPLIIRPEIASDSSITTRTEFGMYGDARTESWLLRGNLGWFWQFYSGIYLNLGAGMVRPFAVQKSIKVEGVVDAPNGADDAQIQGALAKVKETKEDELEVKALGEMQPALEKNLPVLTLGIGYSF